MKKFRRYQVGRCEKTKCAIFLLIFFLFGGSLLFSAAADDGHHEKHRDFRHESHEDDDRYQSSLGPVSNPVYKELCGACHFLYQPQLLPAASWTKILAGTGEHFGEVVALDDNAKREILGYLQQNSAEFSSAKPAVRIMRSLGNQFPVRITGIPYIQEKHYGIPPEFMYSLAVGSPSNCIACHTTAEKGIYDDDHVKIPR